MTSFSPALGETRAPLLALSSRGTTGSSSVCGRSVVSAGADVNSRSRGPGSRFTSSRSASGRQTWLPRPIAALLQGGSRRVCAPQPCICTAWYYRQIICRLSARVGYESARSALRCVLRLTFSLLARTQHPAQRLSGARTCQKARSGLPIAAFVRNVCFPLGTAWRPFSFVLSPSIFWPFLPYAGPLSRHGHSVFSSLRISATKEALRSQGESPSLGFSKGL